MRQRLTCLTPLKPTGDQSIYEVYDHATRLTFKLAQAVNEHAFLAIHLNHEDTYLYRDNVKLHGDSFEITTDGNFLDAMKDFADSGQEYITLSVQLELNEGNFNVEEQLLNPWF